ncbi:MAG: hypothetical protein VYA97_06970, partial [Pseudomonadota bacterium]|nr:hypothetical protein [Pseudomonadota bacterium]
ACTADSCDDAGGVASCLYDPPHPVCELDGVCGVHRIRPTEPQKVYTLNFARDEVVFVNGSALVHCPNGALEGENLMVTPKASAYTPLPRDIARAVCRELAAVTGC